MKRDRQTGSLGDPQPLGSHCRRCENVNRPVRLQRKGHRETDPGFSGPWPVGQQDAAIPSRRRKGARK